MLGVYLAPNGNNKLQVQKLKEKATKMTEYIRTGHIKKNEAWIALTTMAMKSVKYPLPELTLTEKECEEIMWILIKTFLPRTGINRNIKRDVLYGDLEVQGLGIKSLYLTQGLSHIADIIEHTWKQTITGHLIKVCLENLRIELGCNIPILESKYEDYDEIIMTESWIQSTWLFMSGNSIKLKDNTPFIPLGREEDKILMEHFMLQGYKGIELRNINCCRLYLKVITLADITSGDGETITRKHGM